jgi:trimeric autotransporter adhesin
MRALTFMLLSAFAIAAQAETFTYRGSLEDGGLPAEGRYDLRLTLYADAHGKQALSGPIELREVPMAEGNFAVSVDVPGLPPHLERGWLEVAVKSLDDGAWWPLPERSEVLLKGAVCPASWALGGNAGTDPELNFLGTTDGVPLVLKIGAERVALFQRVGGTAAPSVVLGSSANLIGNVLGATISGGGLDTFPNRVSESFGTVGGGAANTAKGNASVVGGGTFNCAGGAFSWAGGFGAAVRPTQHDPDENDPCFDIATTENPEGDEGTFMWAGYHPTLTRFTSTGPNQFLVRAQGGVGINTGAPAAHLHVQRTPAFDDIALFASTSGANVRMASGVTSSASLLFSDPNGLRASITAFEGSTFTLRANGAIQLRTGGNTTRFQLTEDGGISIRRGPGGPDADKAIQVGTNTSTGNGAHLTNTGVWTNASSRSFKHAFEVIDPLAVLERVVSLPVMRWSYRGQDAVRHIGPTAEDFHAAFGLGTDERYIGAVDADGVALAAIQGLNAQNVALREELAAVRAEVAALRELLLATHSNEVP